MMMRAIGTSFLPDSGIGGFAIAKTLDDVERSLPIPLCLPMYTWNSRAKLLACETQPCSPLPPIQSVSKHGRTLEKSFLPPPEIMLTAFTS